jgi:hypothetical protein
MDAEFFRIREGFAADWALKNLLEHQDTLPSVYIEQ